MLFLIIIRVNLSPKHGKRRNILTGKNMTSDINRREFIATLAGIMAIPGAVFTPDAEFQDRDLEKILRELPQAQPHIARIKAACEKYSSIFPLPFIWPVKIQAIESGYNPDAISNSYAVGGAQFMPATARELGARLPEAGEFKPQEEVLVLRKQYQAKFDEAVAAFRRGEDHQAAALRDKAGEIQKEHDKLHEVTMSDFKQRMLAMSEKARREYDARFDPVVSDDLLVQYLAILAGSLKKDLDLTDNSHILLLAAVAYNAGLGNVKRKPGIPVATQNVEYANKIMIFQKLKL